MTDTPSDKSQNPEKGVGSDLATVILDKIAWMENLFVFMSLLSFIGGYYLSLKFPLDYEIFIVLGIIFGIFIILYKHISLLLVAGILKIRNLVDIAKK